MKNEKIKTLEKLCRNCGNSINDCVSCQYLRDLELDLEDVQDFLNSVKTLENAKAENSAYLECMDGYKNLDKTEKCTHRKAKTQTAFKPLEDSALEVAEVVCLECQQFIGFVYRTVRTESVLDTQKMPLTALEDLDAKLRETDTHLKLKQKRIRNTVKFIMFANDRNSYILDAQKS